VLFGVFYIYYIWNGFPRLIVPFVYVHVGDVFNGIPVSEEYTVPLKIDLGKMGFNAVLKPYQIEIMKYLWANPGEGKSSKQVYDAVIEVLPEGKSISRPSIIISLNALAEDGVLRFHEVTGRGGHRRIYRSIYDESGFKRYIAETALRKLLQEFPEETRTVLQSI